MEKVEQEQAKILDKFCQWKRADWVVYAATNKTEIKRGRATEKP